jgi:hypothetical protein
VDTPNNAATATSTATVSDAALGAGPASSVAATGGIGFAGPVGTFTDDNGGATVADFVARIDWGDGTMSAGAVSGPMGGALHGERFPHLCRRRDLHHRGRRLGRWR